MATKKEAVVAENIEDVKPAKAVKDPWKEKVDITLPKIPGGANFETASVNGKVFKIKRGVTVSVPAPIAEVLDHSREAEDAAEAYLDKVTG